MAASCACRHSRRLVKGVSLGCSGTVTRCLVLAAAGPSSYCTPGVCEGFQTRARAKAAPAGHRRPIGALFSRPDARMPAGRRGGGAHSQTASGSSNRKAPESPGKRRTASEPRRSGRLLAGPAVVVPVAHQLLPLGERAGPGLLGIAVAERQLAALDRPEDQRIAREVIARIARDRARVLRPCAELGVRRDCAGPSRRAPPSTGCRGCPRAGRRSDGSPMQLPELVGSPPTLGWPAGKPELTTAWQRVQLPARNASMNASKLTSPGFCGLPRNLTKLTPTVSNGANDESAHTGSMPPPGSQHGLTYQVEVPLDGLPSRAYSATLRPVRGAGQVVEPDLAIGRRAAVVHDQAVEVGAVDLAPDEGARRAHLGLVRRIDPLGRRGRHEVGARRRVAAAGVLGVARPHLPLDLPAGQRACSSRLP